MDFWPDASGSQAMSEEATDSAGLLDLEDALEAKLRLGVLASSLMEHAHFLCADVSLLRQTGAGGVLVGYAADLSVLAKAIQVLERRGTPAVSRS